MQTHIGLDSTQCIKRQPRGIAKYISSLLPEILKIHAPVTLYVRGPKWLQRNILAESHPVRQAKLLVTGLMLRPRGLDHFHSFGNHLPKTPTVPVSLTVHDFRALDLPNGKRKKRKKGRLERNIDKASGIICLTEHGKHRLLQYRPSMDPARVAVIPHGVDHGVYRPIASDTIRKTTDSYELHRPFVLQLGSWFPHKNLELSIRAFANSRIRREGYQLLFVGGGATGEYRNQLERIAAQEKLHEIRWLEHVPESNLPHLIAGASCLLQPSRYEGFGLPIIEAMATGIPGITSTSSCLPEVSADIWPSSDVNDFHDFAEQMDRVCLDEASRKSMINRGLAHAATFTWQRCAMQTVAFLKRLSSLEPRPGQMQN